MVSLLALLFIVTLPFTGLEVISARVSAAGLPYPTLTLMLLLLVAIVNEPQKARITPIRCTRHMINLAVHVAPIYMRWRAGRYGYAFSNTAGRRIVCMAR